MMALKVTEVDERLGNILLDAAKKLNEQAIGRGKRLVMVPTESGASFVEVDTDLSPFWDKAVRDAKD
jgi:hypothetical protein